MIYEHHKSKLNQNCQFIYDNMYNSFVRMQMTVECKTLMTKDVFDVFNAVYFDHPELFYISHAQQVSQKMGLFGGSVTLTSKSIFSQAEIYQYRQVMMQTAKLLETKAKNCKSTTEKVKLVCDYLIQNVNYAIDNDFNQNAGTALVKKVGQCSGIAKAVKFLFDYLEIESLVINGTATDRVNGITGPHSWNMVNVDGHWYQLDVTFMIGANASKRQPFNYLYFNYSDKQMSVEHQWDIAHYPSCPTDGNSNGHGVNQIKNVPKPNTNFQSYSKPNTNGNGVNNNASPFNSATGTNFNFNSQPFNRQNANGSQPFSNTNSTYTNVKTISSYAQFTSELKGVFDNKLTKFEFVSNIPENDANRVVKTLLDKTLQYGKQRNVGFSINVKSVGKNVTLEFVWA